MNIKFDEGEVEGSKYLGIGEHEVTITAIKPGASKTKGTPQIEVEFSARSGKTTRDWFVTEGNKFKLAALAIACGFTKEDLLSGRFSTDMLARKRLRVVREVTGMTEDGKNKYEQSYLPTQATGAVGGPAGHEDPSIPF